MASCGRCCNARRFRGIQTFGQFRGQACSGTRSERERCSANGRAVLPPPPFNCSASQFKCESGTCIKKSQQCNYDIDCEDQSDEFTDCSEPLRKPCAKELETNHHGRSVGYGVNILGSAPGQNPFFNEFFNGVCHQMWDPTQRAWIRLPWNVASLHYETNIEETISREIYKTSHRLLNEVLRETTLNIKGGLSFKFGLEMEKVQAGVNAGLEVEYDMKSMVKEILETTNTKNKNFIRVNGKLQFATYRMRPRDLRVADGFLRDVELLPLEYEQSAYFDFLEQYGTHYTRYGKLGGEYHLVYVLDNEVVARRTNPTEDALVDKVLTSVKGGDSVAAAALKTVLNKDGMMDAATYAAWAQSVIENPALIYSETDPIYMLIPLDMPNANVWVANLKQGIANYVAEYSVCKCKPCHNGGTVVLIDGSCTCLCDIMYEGLACQNYLPDKATTIVSRPAVTQMGNWGCWLSWSPCDASRQRSRVRACKSEGLGVGATCPGSASELDEC
ncbi:Complement component C9 [Merluccius polli]|uniref:Complement component C9 n=1 Tax=Merluccius polli TaxID=89951 RepID=A0AA47P901_MERPO|nr:Complement component C9 [Merluccius polli]